jgi:ADP-heptose:LPS heptosyltransferase
LLRQCLAGAAWDERLVDLLVAEDCSDALFGILVEGLADRFEARLCEAYTAIFSRVLKRLGYAPREASVREPKICRLEPERVVVLSRVTLGADIALTSVMLDALRQRFPHSEIWFAGSRKSFDLFAGFPWIRHFEVTYPRGGGIANRLAAWKALSGRFPGALVVDPDSRLTQSGLLPVSDEEHTFFFESRSYGGDGGESLTALAQRWVAETFGIEGAHNRIAPGAADERPGVTVSLGAGDNPAKQMPEEFEAELIRLLCARFEDVLVDRGFGPEETARIDRVTAGTGARTFTGSFARFASLIASSGCYVGYDSAGQHAAAACGTPLLTLFKGAVCDRMFARWQPAGRGPKEVLRIEDTISIEEVEAALDRLLRKF